MNQFTTITWEQAVNQEKIAPVAEQYFDQLKEVIHYFTSNTIAQITHSDLYFKAFELADYYHQKDYSRFLFDETEKYFNAILEEKEIMDSVRNIFLKVSKTLNEIIKK